MEQFVYILQCNDGTYYTGWTTDLDRRIQMHNKGQGAKYTKSRRPVKLVYRESCPTKSEALKREYQIKQLSRKEKETLIRNGI
ncbi:MAG: GIY-YIG nuclease family protein [Erysipelotrichaceae bacterium]|nr:GIY-YIG nuclease family protein [Erysipelotrichaceae bacterium]